MRRGRSRFIAISCWFLSARLSCLSGQTLGAEFPVNSSTFGTQWESAVAGDGAGGFVVVWSSEFQESYNFGIFGQRFGADGSPVGGEFHVNSYTTGDQRSPAVAVDATGSFLVVWASHSQDGSLEGVFAQRFDPAGSPAGSEFQVNTYTTENQYAPAIAKTGAGGFVVVWQSNGQDGSGWGVFGQRLDADGAALGSEFQVSSATLYSQAAPQVAGDAAGGFVVVWEAFGQYSPSYDVVGRRFDAAGQPVGVEFQANAYATGDQWEPKVAMDGAGRFVVAWQSYGEDGSAYGVFGQRFGSAGAFEGGQFQVNSTTWSSQWQPAVAVDDAGRFVVTWTSTDQDGSEGGMFGQRFDAAGGPMGSEFQINSYTTWGQDEVAVAVDGSGNYVAVWRSYLQDGSLSGVFGQRLAGVLFADGLESADACLWSAAVGGGCP